MISLLWVALLLSKYGTAFQALWLPSSTGFGETAFTSDTLHLIRETDNPTCDACGEVRDMRSENLHENVYAARFAGLARILLRWTATCFPLRHYEDCGWCSEL